MKPKAITATKESARHWHRLATGTRHTDEQLRPKDCALCQLYFTKSDDREARCTGCPIHEKTGHPGCAQTPYIYVSALFLGVPSQHHAAVYNHPTFQTVAAEERDFIIALLPEDHAHELRAELGLA
jgi:hypothetical protein